MTNFEKACKLASEWVESMGGLDNISYRYGDDVSGLVQAIDDAGLLMPSPQIIRTVEELEVLDRETLLVDRDGDTWYVSDAYWGGSLSSVYISGLPAIVLVTSEQQRTALEALGGESHG